MWYLAATYLERGVSFFILMSWPANVMLSTFIAQPMSEVIGFLLVLYVRASWYSRWFSLTSIYGRVVKYRLWHLIVCNILEFVNPLMFSAIWCNQHAVVATAVMSFYEHCSRVCVYIPIFVLLLNVPICFLTDQWLQIIRVSFKVLGELCHLPSLLA